MKPGVSQPLKPAEGGILHSKNQSSLVLKTSALAYLTRYRFHPEYTLLNLLVFSLV